MAHHEGLGKQGKGLKAPDSHCLPVCFLCHRSRHDLGKQRFYACWLGVSESVPKEEINKVVKEEIVNHLTQYIRETQNIDTDILIIDSLTEQIK